ncbi:DUF5810 domain-containing protein [Haloarcula marina]|uniref:DUF5810 domain-containing protein n=1 Tax=Haloarcula marina TaxID=2961574 RepID=UPI0020B8982B|nr:DUF5810 domain-containing protein [Halomicroarcula marina]
MGYTCPVCGDPQSDAGHLANHLAFTAMTGGDDHAAWLDDHVDDWGQMGESELAEVVVDHAEETEFPQVFEESGLDDHDEGHDHSDGHSHGRTPASDLPSGADSHQGQAAMSDEDRSVLAEARDLTREMLEENDEETDSSAEDETQ